MLHKVKLVTMRLRSYDDSVLCDTSKIAAYRAECSCGWRSRWRGAWGLARKDGETHRLGARHPT